MMMLHHISLSVSDLQRATQLYDAMLAPLGYVRIWTYPDAVGYGPPGGGDKLALKKRVDTVMAPSPGFHVALSATHREAIHAFHAAALTRGAQDNGPPGLREHYGPHYYAAFVIDPDGYVLEAVINTPPSKVP